MMTKKIKMVSQPELVEVSKLKPANLVSLCFLSFVF